MSHKWRFESQKNDQYFELRWSYTHKSTKMYHFITWLGSSVRQTSASELDFDNDHVMTARRETSSHKLPSLMFYFKSESLKTTDLGLLSRHTKVQGTYGYKLISHAGETMYSFLEPVRASQDSKDRHVGSKDRHVGSVRIGLRIHALILVCHRPVLVPCSLFGLWIPNAISPQIPQTVQWNANATIWKF